MFGVVNNMHERIGVTRAFLPPRREYDAYLDKIWSSNYLTNQGPLLKLFESKASEHLNVSNFHFVANGTLALQIALKSLSIDGGEIITTPFTYVATISSILWERCKPVFVDINPNNFCMDVDLIEAAITKNTKAIMPTHVFGISCDVVRIDEIAKKNKLKVIYDAAHAFGVEVHGRSLLDYGDISICSFHATKIFHTIEGGALVVKSNDINKKVELIKRFGHNGDDHIMLGINAKSSEFNAAMGIINLKYVDKIIEKRKKIYETYRKSLNDTFYIPKPEIYQKYNYAYMPILFDSEEDLELGFEALRKKNIHPRRYFYPSLNKLPYLSEYQPCPVSEDISKRVACLPLYDTLSTEKAREISQILNYACNV